MQAIIGIDPGLRRTGWGVIEALLNGETWFRRDRATFEVLERELLPALTVARGGPVRILSAGSGSGQEAYSLAIAALEAGARVEGTRKPAGAAGSAVPSGKAHMSPRASSRSASHQASSRGAAGTFGAPSLSSSASRKCACHDASV